ncbi:MAG: hypothetical protein K6E13_03110 [Lachnospiraceae bacterium]|nr:hypothetical protein [Lachnospiraceae bacterium]
MGILKDLLFGAADNFMDYIDDSTKLSKRDYNKLSDEKKDKYDSFHDNWDRLRDGKDALKDYFSE